MGTFWLSDDDSSLRIFNYHDFFKWIYVGTNAIALIGTIIILVKALLGIARGFGLL